MFWGDYEESDMTERLHFHFSLLCVGEGNGNPRQCSCLENPRDGGAQSRTRLSSNSSIDKNIEQLEAVIRRKARTLICRRKIIAAILKSHSPLNTPLKTK